MFQMAKVAMVRATADAATGAFKLEHVPAGKLLVSASTEDGSRGKTPVVVGDGDVGNLVVTLETRASISGTVIDTSGAPAVGAQVDAHSNAPRKQEGIDFQGGSTATVAADGTFKIVGLEPASTRSTARWGWDDYLDKEKTRRTTRSRRRSSWRRARRRPACT